LLYDIQTKFYNLSPNCYDLFGKSVTIRGNVLIRTVYKGNFITDNIQFGYYPTYTIHIQVKKTWYNSASQFSKT